MIGAMTIRTTWTYPTTVPVPTAGCPECSAEQLHCHETLVLHADGTAECEGYPACGLDPAAHDLWMACAALEAWGYTGEDHDLDAGLPLAA
jgi:hypothetical protein